MLWLYPGVLHGYRPTTRWRQVWTLFSGPATTALTTLGHLDASQPVRRYADPRPVDRAFTRLLRVSTAHSAVQTVAALYDLIARAAPVSGDGVAAQLAELACTPLSVQDYAAELGLTVKELREAVRRTTGSTPQELVLTTRLNTAKSLLVEEDLSVAAVARRGRVRRSGLLHPLVHRTSRGFAARVPAVWFGFRADFLLLKEAGPTFRRVKPFSGVTCAGAGHRYGRGYESTAAHRPAIREPAAAGTPEEAAELVPPDRRTDRPAVHPHAGRGPAVRVEPDRQDRRDADRRPPGRDPRYDVPDGRIGRPRGPHPGRAGPAAHRRRTPDRPGPTRSC